MMLDAVESQQGQYVLILLNYLLIIKKIKFLNAEKHVLRSKLLYKTILKYRKSFIVYITEKLFL
jgi:hypothetical protein